VRASGRSRAFTWPPGCQFQLRAQEVGQRSERFPLNTSISDTATCETTLARSPLSNPPPTLFAAATLELGAARPSKREHCTTRGAWREGRKSRFAPSVPVSDNSEDTGEGILMREPLLGMVPKVACEGT
jgi:hypothetical protein